MLIGSDPLLHYDSCFNVFQFYDELPTYWSTNITDSGTFGLVGLFKKTQTLGLLSIHWLVGWRVDIIFYLVCRNFRADKFPRNFAHLP